MLESNVIKFGVCVGNEDPYGNQRIRVLMLEDEVSTLNRNTNINELIQKRDQYNQNNLGAGAYVKWEVGQPSRTDDPYVVPPFLPLNINTVPKIGELVKVIQYNLDSDTGYREYIGPATSEIKNNYYENFKTSVNAKESSLNLTRKDRKRKQPNIANTNLSGRKNSYIEFLNDGLLMSGGKYKDSELLNENLAFKYLKRFPNKQKVVESEETIIETPTVPINNVIEYRIDENGVYELTMNIYNTEEVLNNNNYSPKYEYLTNLNKRSLVITASSDKVQNLVRFTQKLLDNIDENRIGLDLDTALSDSGVDYFIEDLRKPVNGVDVRGEQYLDLGLYIFRETPSTRAIEKTKELQFFVDSFTVELRPVSKLPKQKATTLNIKNIEPISDKGESYNIDYASYNMTLHDAGRIRGLLKDEGFTQDDILIHLIELTEPTVRGYKLAEILLKIISVIENHGHSTTGPNTINEGVKQNITSLKNDLLSILDKDLTNTNPLVNEKIRIS